MHINPFMRAHGASPGPRMRPSLTGAVAGLVGLVAGLVVLIALQAQHQLVLNFGRSLVITTEALYGIVAGAVYGKIFRRAALDWRGAWLFGMSFGFILWMFAFAGLAPWVYGKPLLEGPSAFAVLLAHFVFGAAMGLVFPVVHMILYRPEVLAANGTNAMKFLSQR